MKSSASAKVGWGLLGASGIAGRAMAPAIAGSGHGRLVAVASRDQAKAGAFAAKHSIARSYGGYEALLADEEVEVVDRIAAQQRTRHVGNSRGRGWQACAV